jgi:hypothetical protein
MEGINQLRQPESHQRGEKLIRLPLWSGVDTGCLRCSGL